MDGHAVGLFLTDTLIKALTDLARHKTTDAIVLLKELQKQERSANEKMLNTDVPEAFTYSVDNGAFSDPSLDLEVLWKGPSLCRTGRLPALSRYLGYTTNTDKIGDIAVVGSEEYDTGISILDAGRADVVKDGYMILVRPINDKGHFPACDVLLSPDSKDVFYAHQLHGVVKLSIPNEREKQAYGYDPFQYKGLIVLVFHHCLDGKCNDYEVRPEDYSEDKFEVTVNGKRVTELVSIGLDVVILKGEDSFYWEADSFGIFELGFLVKKERGDLMVSSIILY